MTVIVDNSRMLREPIDRARGQEREEAREEDVAEMVAHLLAARPQDAMPAHAHLVVHNLGLRPEMLRDILDTE